MASPFDNLSDDQLLALIREAESGNKSQEQAPKFSVNVGGSVIEAASQEELNAAVQAKLEEALRANRPAEQPQPQPQPNVPARPSWDMKTFVEKFTNDPDEGLTYMETAKYGMPIRQAVPQMLAIIAALGQKVGELETASFAPKEAAERDAVNEILRSRGWAPSRQAYEDALLVAKATGKIKTTEEKTQQDHLRNERGQFTSPGTFIPPRIPRTTGGDQGEQNAEEIIRSAWNMPEEKLRQLLVDAGHLKV